ncbi:hypothetical protein [Burkholderia phage BCSR5]|nr:hypothetical protein [Burkholderia phage BCSR5]
MSKRVPDKDTVLPFNHEDVRHIASNQKPALCITYDEAQGEWTIVPKSARGGMFVFLTEQPKSHHTHVRIYGIVNSGKAARGETFKQ